MPDGAHEDGGDFFIVDNSDEHWKALEYLRQWCEISSSIDIATGYFEVGSLLALDGAWQKVDRIRILIGAETSRQTVEAIRQAKEVLDASLDHDRQEDPFLEGLDGVVQAIRDGRIEIRVYRKRKFHAKAYITRGRLDVVGSAALVGSSNFTVPGLTRNVELNVRFNGVEVRDLQAWYQAHWDDAEEATGEILKVLEHHDRSWSPFEVYARALQVLTENVEPSEAEWERDHSAIYPMLAPYQREAYHGLKQRAAQWRGAFLTDGVGLGKTFVGLMLAEYYAVKERKNVLILATKTGQDAVWEPELQRLLPNLTGDFTNVRVMAHTDLSRQDALERIAQLSERVDVVIIDEAHNFRNRGKKGDEDEGPLSRWWRLQEITVGKTVFMLTATPINNSLLDFAHQVEIFTGADESGYFTPLGVPHLTTYVSRLERTFLKQISGTHDASDSTLDLEDFQELLEKDKLLGALIVQNSRQYAQKSAKASDTAPVLFPEPDLPRAVPYQYNVAYSKLLDEVEKAFEKKAPLFTLPMYYPLAYSKLDDVDTKVENRQRQVVGLIRTTFLKRFESSIAAFAGSCAVLAMKIAQWIADNAAQMPEYLQRLEAWEQRYDRVFADVHEQFRPGVDRTHLEFSDDEADDAIEEDYPLDVLDPDDYDLTSMFEAAFEDLFQLTNFMERTVDVGNVNDDKYSQLHALLTGGKATKGKDPQVFDPDFASQKVLVFTEFADTARYLHDRLVADGLTEVDRLDGSRKGNRVDMIRRFAPHYNRVPPEEREALKPLRVLVSTDVLSEGVNLQDASLIVNYDIHWNPVRLMQRIGRIDRRMNQEIEDAIVEENPSTEPIRNLVKVRNFLPPDELNRILRLYNRVQARVLLISETLGIPGGRLLTKDDMLNDTKVFSAFLEEYEGDVSPLEQLRLRYLDLLNDHPGLEELLADMPRATYAAREGEDAGLFMCSVEPIRHVADDGEDTTWTLEQGRPRWALRRPDGSVVDDLMTIDAAIRSEPHEASVAVSDRVAVSDALSTWRKERHHQLMKEAQLPLDAPRPATVCWMEVR